MSALYMFHCHPGLDYALFGALQYAILGWKRGRYYGGKQKAQGMAELLSIGT
jgi:hypothetical protein